MRADEREVLGWFASQYWLPPIALGLFNAPVKRKFRIPVPDPRLPGPGAGYPAAGPGAGCRLPGRPFFGFSFRKNSKNCSTDSQDPNKNLNFFIKKNHLCMRFYVGQYFGYNCPLGPSYGPLEAHAG